MNDNQINRIRVGKKIPVTCYEEISFELAEYLWEMHLIGRRDLKPAKWIDGTPYKVTII